MASDSKISNTGPKFTYDPPNWKMCVKLIGAGPRKFCEITGPRECRGDRNTPKECDEIFRQCFEKAESFDRWSRTN